MNEPNRKDEEGGGQGSRAVPDEASVSEPVDSIESIEHREPVPVDPASEEEADVSAEVDELRREVQYLNDRHLRLAAEFDNYRKRSQMQLGESGIRAQAQLVGKVVEVLDDLERVTSLDPEAASVESVLEGVALLQRKLLQLLEESGLEEVHPEGEPFDPNVMEAMARHPAETPEEDDTVEEVFQRGFRFRGHLVRPARVSVRKYD